MAERTKLWLNGIELKMEQRKGILRFIMRKKLMIKGLKAYLY